MEGLQAFGAGWLRAALASVPRAALAASLVARAPGGGAWFRDPLVGVQEKSGAGLWLRLAEFSFRSQTESGSRVSAECCLWGPGVVYTPASSLNDIGTKENRRACLVNLATKQVGPARTALSGPLLLPRPVGMMLNDNLPWPIAATTDLIFLWRDFESQPKWNRVVPSLVQKLSTA